MTPYLTGYRVSTKKVKAVADAEHFVLWPNKKIPTVSQKFKKPWPHSLTILADCFTEKRLKKLFSLPVQKIVDVQAVDESIHTFLQNQNGRLNNSLSFLLTCPVMYKCDVALLFVNALKKRLKLSKSLASDVHIALHETIVNGLIHGNLQIGSSYRQDARSFVEYSRVLLERLQNPDFARKGISISARWDANKLSVKVRDNGAGYIIRDDQCNYSSETLRNKSGRGLLFIAGIADSCTIDDFGREIDLTFKLEQKNLKEKKSNPYTRTRVSSFFRGERPSIGECRVLIIEDNLSNQTMLHQLLNVIGINMVECASNGIDGLKKVKVFKPDLIILDITIPKMNGYEVLYQLKMHLQTQDIPVLIESESDTREERDKTFSAGATDFITKPINPLEFFSRIRVHLENRIFIKYLEKQLAQIDEELSSAQKMQRTILPSNMMLKNIEKRYHIEIAHYFEPSSRLGGDFWQLIPLSQSKLAIYICDFSGHGMSSALNTFRLHALMTQLDPLNIEIPASAVAMMNLQLLSLLPRGQFATFFLGVIDFEKDEMIYSSAGIPNPFLITGKNKIELLSSEGMPLGISKQAIYHNLQVPFPRGAKLVLYSDALTESLDVNGNRSDEAGFANLVASHLNLKTAKSIVLAVMNDFKKNSPPPLSDDVTFVFLKRKEGK